MFAKQTIQLKFGLVFVLTLILIFSALIFSLRYWKGQVLRNEARAVAAQVVSFRAWISRSGVMWVDHLVDEARDYLNKYEYSPASAAGGATDAALIAKPSDMKTFYAKNPALATRELSDIVNKSATRATFTVTSDKFRQPNNAPDAFEIQAIQAIDQDKKLPYIDTFEDGTYRYVQPIFVEQSCLRCHGDPKDAPAAVIEKYGAEKAFGYKVGDVRGIISVKLPELKLLNVLTSLANPVSLLLFALAIAANFLFTQYGLIRRLRRLTESATAIAKGELETPMQFNPPAETRDELDHAYNAVHLLRNSLRIAMRHMSLKK